MTQAFNLAQLANNLNTSGQLDATDGLNGLVANANLASSGTPSSTTFLRGDRTWGTVTQRILQVVQSTRTTTFTVTGSPSAWTDVSGLSASITPSSSSNKILVLLSISTSQTANTYGQLQLVRGSTTIFGGVADGASNSAMAGLYGGNSSTGSVYYNSIMQGGVFLDSPATTSATTYKIQAREIDGGVLAINWSAYQASNSIYYPRSASSITLIEVAA